MSPVPDSAAIAPSSPLIRALPDWALVPIAIVSVQFGAAVAKGLFNTAGPGGVVFLRTLLAGVLFMVVWRPRVRGHSRKAYGYMLAYGATIAVMMLAFYAAIDLIPLGITVAIAFAGPLLVAVLGSRKPIDFVWIGLASGGILLLSPITSTDLNPVGMMLALLSSASWAVYILLTKRINRLFDGNTALALAMCVAAVVALPFGITGAATVLLDPALLLLSLIVALLSSAIPFWLEFVALKTLSSRAFGLLVSLEPVVAALIGFVVLRETLGGNEMVGIALVTIAAVATTRTASE